MLLLAFGQSAPDLAYLRALAGTATDVTTLSRHQATGDAGLGP